ncbi:MAG: ThiF family adenylyltransferase [Promethearchaeota archaeon]
MVTNLADNRAGSFHRQELITWWEQEKVGSTSALVVGLGEVNCHVALELARLGIGSVVLCDEAPVREVDLNAQVLFSRGDIGRRRSLAARDNLTNFHRVGGTEIGLAELDPLRNWQKFLEFARKSDLVFNGLPPPEVHRVALASACKFLGKPTIYAGVDAFSGFSGSVLTQFPGEPGEEPCYECLQAALDGYASGPDADAGALDSLRPSEVVKLESLNFPGDMTRGLGDFVPRTCEPAAALVASLAVSISLRIAHHAEGRPADVPHRVVIDLINSSIERSMVPAREGCLVCGRPPPQ